MTFFVQNKKSAISAFNYSQTRDKNVKPQKKGLEPLRAGFGDYVKMQGLDAMAGLATQGQVDPKLYVQKVIEVYEKAERLNQNSFGGEFKEALDKAATAYINKNKACEGNKVFFLKKNLI